MAAAAFGFSELRSLNGTFKANSSDFSQFTSPSTYQGANSMATAIAISTATQPIASDGLLLGWKAADELLSVDHASGNHRLQKDAWSLVAEKIGAVAPTASALLSK